MIDRRARLPVYAQVEDYIRQRIRSGQWQPGGPIPAERELAQTLGVSRLSVRQAIFNLSQEGLLRRRQGSGTYVSERSTSHLLLRFGGFAEDMLRTGVAVTTRLLEYARIPAGAAEAAELRVAPGAPLVLLTRLRSTGEGPVLLGTSLIPWDVCPLTRADCAGPSLYAALAACAGRAPVRAVHSVGAVPAGVLQVRHLKVQPGAPLLYVEGTAYTPDDTPVELYRNFFRADRIRFALRSNE